MEILCEVHQKPMKQNTKGYYCSTPLKKSPDGKIVLEWCTWKPAGQAPKSSERDALVGQVLATINTKIDKLAERLEFLIERRQ